LMQQIESFAYVEGGGDQMVELPHDGPKLSMVILHREVVQSEALGAPPMRDSWIRS
jgi:serine protease inhibitor